MGTWSAIAGDMSKTLSFKKDQVRVLVSGELRGVQGGVDPDPVVKKGVIEAPFSSIYCVLAPTVYKK